jgi:hypothetical protein
VNSHLALEILGETLSTSSYCGWECHPYETFSPHFTLSIQLSLRWVLGCVFPLRLMPSTYHQNASILRKCLRISHLVMNSSPVSGVFWIVFVGTHLNYLRVNFIEKNTWMVFIAIVRDYHMPLRLVIEIWVQEWARNKGVCPMISKVVWQSVQRDFSKMTGIYNINISKVSSKNYFPWVWAFMYLFYKIF